MMEENVRHIEIRVLDDSNFLSPFSGVNDAVISDELAGFVENRVGFVRTNESVKLSFRGSCIEETEKKSYTNAIRAYYKEESNATKRELSRNRFIAFIMLAIGVLIIALSIFVNYTYESEIWSEVLDIVAWVLIWECVDILLFKNRENKMNMIKFRALSLAEIEFIVD